MEYTVILHPADEGGYWSEVPTLPGCFSQGESVEETLEHTKEAIESHLMALREDGHTVTGEAGLIISRVQVAA